MNEPPQPDDAESGDSNSSRSTPHKSDENLITLENSLPRSDSRSRIYIPLAILIFGALLILLFFGRSKSPQFQAARRILFGQPLANAAGLRGGSGDDLPDADARGDPRTPDAPIGRLPSVLGERKPGDETRPGAGGTDDPAGRVGNSRTGQITDSPSAGGDPGNSDRTNRVEFPEGRSPRIGSGAGDGQVNLGSDLPSTNRQALLLDDFSERLKQAGARSGDVQVSLEWKNMNDLDLHVIDPSGEEISYDHRQSRSGGLLDVDMNVQPYSERPVENVYWPERGAPRGTYRVEVVHYRNHTGAIRTPFTVRVIVKGKATYYTGAVSFVANPHRARVAVCTFTVQ